MDVFIHEEYAQRRREARRLQREEKSRSMKEMMRPQAISIFTDAAAAAPASGGSPTVDAAGGGLASPAAAASPQPAATRLNLLFDAFRAR